jgi:hypothetical protein
MERHSNHPPLPSEQPAQERQNLPSVSDILAQKAQLEERARGRRKGWAYHRESSRLGNDLLKLYLEGTSHDRLLLDLYAAETQPPEATWVDWSRSVPARKIRKFIDKVAPLTEDVLEEELGKAIEAREERKKKLDEARRRSYQERRQRRTQTEPEQVFPPPEK